MELDSPKSMLGCITLLQNASDSCNLSSRSSESMDLRLKTREDRMAWPVLVFLMYLILPSGASNAEGNALFAIKQSLNDPKGVLKSWNADLVDPCSSWTFVTCDQEKHVIEVSLGGQGFSGVLSTQVAYLPKLQTLELQNNFLSGLLPNALRNLTELQSLNVHNNSFSGGIPSSLGQLSNLKYLTLSNNKLSGGIPTEIFALSSLLSVDLSFNNLTGIIPNAAFKIPQYSFVGNQLTCMSSSELSCQLSRSMGSALQNQVSSKKSNIAALVGGIMSAVIVLMAAIVISSMWWDYYHHQKQDVFVDVADEGDLKVSFGQLKRFSWRELQVATDNFNDKNVLGQGGFSKVFKGVLGDGTQIAVKRLKDNHLPGGEAVFLREVEMIGVAVHRNLLKLIGFCAIPSERLLVYPYMVNRSVAYQLREMKTGDAKLTWPKRKQIASGAARGLAYLHDHCNPRIIHRDVKAANILLDENFQAVVGDFGLAKLVDTKDTHVTTVVRGTMGHIAPEYLSTGRSSEKTDVFGYGIMLLELVTGQRAIDFSRLQEDGVLLLDHVKKLQREKRLVSIVDPSLQLYNAQEVEELIQIALLCTQPTPEDRPKMEDVARMLAGEGLAERWEEWQQVEGLRRQEYELMPHRLAEWVEDSAVNQEAIELSAGR